MFSSVMETGQIFQNYNMDENTNCAKKIESNNDGDEMIKSLENVEKRTSDAGTL